MIKFSVAHYSDIQVSNRALREIRAAQKPKSDLILLLGDLEARLKALNVRVLDTPSYSVAHQIDENAFGDALQEEIGYLGAQALAHDINSIRSIYVKRGGATPARLEDAKAVLVTSNSSFARAAFEQGKNHNSAREISPVITDYSLANIAWLKAPLKKPELPERETLALCYAALEPSRALLEKYVRTMDEMRASGVISENDHAILRASGFAQSEVMDMTLGDDAALTHQSVSELLARAKGVLVADLSEQHARVLGETNARQSQLEGLLAQASRDTAAEREAREVLQIRVTKRANGIARYVFVFIFCAISLGLLVGAVVAGGLISTGSFSVYGRFVLIVLAGAAVLWGWWNWHSGQTLRSILKTPEERLARAIARLFVSE